ncbi:hypothetical protein ACSCBZ_41210 [Streptomyces niveiscabiei]|uniref:hypothetical protein n=1 Tax=Streptomyces niveiscabiei TaxID=164115 RepID=UPI000A64D322|nr:hypothetical protein [Streptomyces niveiscabiei]
MGDLWAGTRRAADSIPTHMEALLGAMFGAVVSVMLVFLTSWDGDRRKRREEERKAVADDRAALEAALDEFVAAVLAVEVEGNAHDYLWGGWRAKSVVAFHALVQGGAAYYGSGAAGFGRKGMTASLMAAYGAASDVIRRWDSESTVSAVRLAAPLARLGASLPPLLRRSEPGIAEAAQEAFNAASAHKDTDRTDRALSALYQAFVALPAPAVRRRRFLRRRTVAGSALN